MSLAHSHLYVNNKLLDDNLLVQNISGNLHNVQTAMWIDYLEPTFEELSEIARELDLHELAIEDSIHSHQRPKVDYYDSHFLLHAMGLILMQSWGYCNLQKSMYLLRITA